MKSKLNKASIIAILLIATMVLSGCGRGMHRMMHRMHRMSGEHFGQMHEFGQKMMPFGHSGRGGRGGAEMMTGVTHVFDKSDDGGVYQLIADDPNDAELVAMIQERLARMAGAEAGSEAGAETEAGSEAGAEAGSEAGAEAEANRGKQGPKEGIRRGPFVFGRGMNGLGQFMDEITVTYSDLDDGGQIAISSENPEVVTLIHTWIEEGPMGRGMGDR